LARPTGSSPPAWSARLLPDRSQSVAHDRECRSRTRPRRRPVSRGCAWMLNRRDAARVGSVQMVARAATSGRGPHKVRRRARRSEA
jgi:hypothetical protein